MTKTPEDRIRELETDNRLLREGYERQVRILEDEVRELREFIRQLTKPDRPEVF